MRIPTTIGLSAVLAAALAIQAPTALGHEPVALFNGKDLSGWVSPPDASLFTVEDGEIVGRTEGNLKKNQFLASEESYKDFNLKVKVKLRNHNSGIQVRSQAKGEGVVTGPQADAAEGYWGLLYDEGGRGILEQYPPEKAEKLIRKGDWNDFDITFKGKRLTIAINGTTVIDRTDEEFPDEGIIAFQVHTGPAMEVRFKDVVIQELH
ncbi:DUF1080 domain-containing protein [Paludisphaera sp.]|uniref:3-keto-disaccharide hydrolase n=1 Tax=Paludisphaera sp. TaxID=2017432 RepID=UPI00301E4560